jgi:hypothetical protein
MRDEKRIDRVLGHIKKIWEKYPDWRLGQLLINTKIVEDTYHTWSVEDDETEKILEKYAE